MTDCARCGDCCEVIRLTANPAEIFETGWLSAPFILDHWHLIDRELAGAINPRITEREGGYFYTCDQFDAERRMCLAHDSRPQICSAFPWYTDPPYTHPEGWAPSGGSLAYFPRCSFWRDVPADQIPDFARPSTWIPLEDVV